MNLPLNQPNVFFHVPRIHSSPDGFRMPIGFAITTCSHSGNSNGPNGAVVVNPSAQYRNAGRVLVTSHLHVESLLFWRENTPKNCPLPRVSSVLGFRYGVLFVAFEDDEGLFLSVKFGSGTIADGEENAG